MQTTTTPAGLPDAVPSTMRAAVRRGIAEQRHVCDLAEIAIQKDLMSAAMLLVGCARDGANDLKVVDAAAAAP